MLQQTPKTQRSSQHLGISCVLTPKRYEIGCQLLLITNRKSHTGFRLIPTSMTLNDLERRNSPYFAFFSPNSIALSQADYVTLVEDGPIMSVKYCLPVPVFHFWPKLTHPAARYLCDSWASCWTCSQKAKTQNAKQTICTVQQNNTIQDKKWNAMKNMNEGEWYTGWLKKVSCWHSTTAYFFEPPCRPIGILGGRDERKDLKQLVRLRGLGEVLSGKMLSSIFLVLFLR